MTRSRWLRRLRHGYREQVLALFRDNDILLALATPYPAPFIGQEMIENDGAMVPARPYQVPVSGTAWRGSRTSTKAGHLGRTLPERSSQD